VVDPWQVINNHGADAFRWYFYSGGSLFAGARFSEAGVVEALQRFVIPLWNIYSFFTIYANIDDFDPAAEMLPWDKLTELDRFALIKTNRTVKEVTEHLDNLELTEAARRIEELVDVVSKWYVRRSRRRFWQPEHDDAKLGAYQTLYRILSTLSRLLAPFMPFIAEELYQKLTRPFDEGAAESVHLTSYPEYDPAQVDDELEMATDRARRVVSLGHAARKESGVRVRQPLSRVTLICAEEGVRSAVGRHLDVILDELNVKAVEWAEDEAEFVSYEYKPNFRNLGPRFGKQAKVVAGWINKNAEEITSQLAKNSGTPAPGSDDAAVNWVEAEIDGEKLIVDEGLFDVNLKEKPDTVAQRDGQLLLVLDTSVSHELKLEGLAREVVNRLQGARKNLDLDYADRITVRYTAEDGLEEAVTAHRGYITGETLATTFTRVDNLDGEAEETSIDGTAFKFTVERV